MKAETSLRKDLVLVGEHCRYGYGPHEFVALRQKESQKASVKWGLGVGQNSE